MLFKCFLWLKKYDKEERKFRLGFSLLRMIITTQQPVLAPLYGDYSYLLTIERLSYYLTTILVIIYCRVFFACYKQTVDVYALLGDSRFRKSTGCV